MIVREAKEAARHWLMAEAAAISGAQGAFFHGSVNWLDDEAPFPATSDVDVMVVLDDPGPQPRVKPGKFRYRGVLLDVSNLASDQLQTPEQILGRYDLAGSIHTASVMWDPCGRLCELQSAVAADYAKRRWVARRRNDAQARILRNLAALDASRPFPDEVTSWLFATGVETHVLLVASLRNPTVRTRYVAVRELLRDYGHLAFYETLLDQLGCAGMSRERVERHLDALTDAFDAAKTVIETPFFLAADISDLGRPVAVGGSRELIARGDHREAVFWIAATYSRCMQVFAHDAPALKERFAPGYRALLADLGIASPADLRERAEGVRAFLPRLGAKAEAIVAANPEIVD